MIASIGTIVRGADRDGRAAQHYYSNVLHKIGESTVCKKISRARRKKTDTLESSFESQCLCFSRSNQIDTFTLYSARIGDQLQTECFRSKCYEGAVLRAH